MLKNINNFGATMINNLGARRKKSPLVLIYLVAFSAVVTNLYDVILGGNFNVGGNDGFKFKPSRWQLNTARRLNMEQRFLDTFGRTVWPECRENDLTAVECKLFIDEMILDVFTEEDKFIRTRIIGKRTEEDLWYNTVSITMDDNNLVLGKDRDGWIYYTLEWHGSGNEATEEQQSEISPNNAIETEVGAAEGEQVTTVYTPEPYEAPGLGEPEPETTELTTVATTTAATTTTITTTTTTNIAEGTAAPMVIEPIATVPVAGVTGEVFNFDEEPVVPLEGTELNVGATTDGAMSGEDANPLAGGVLLNDPTNMSGEIEGRLAVSLDEPPYIHPAGTRTIGPFNCKGLTGFACCLLIKHEVRDADIWDRAIQCHLDYDETTCKKKWWLESETGKKVLIYANHEEKVSLDPVIEGEWPQCDDKWTDTRDWGTADADARCGKDFGDSVCPEGQCCSAWGYCGIGGAHCDFGCQSQCWTTSDASGLAVQERCGASVGGKVCHGTYCCSAEGYCGSGENYCLPEKGCQHHCWPGVGDGVVEEEEELPPQLPEACKGSVNVCLALDMSGSVCSPNFSRPQLCSNCDSDCRDSSLDRNTCCPNFQKVKQFGTDVVNWINHLQFGVNRRSLSLVTFSTTASTKVSLGQDVLNGLDTLDYTGGYTNHGDAIEECQSTFTSDGLSQNFIIVVTDGVATRPSPGGQDHGRDKAAAAKAAGTIIESVFINPADASNSVKIYMNDMSSTGKHHDVSSFEALGKTVNDIAYKVACSGDAPVPTPEAAPAPAAPPATPGVYYCGCTTCTEEVMNTKAGKHTCKKRLDWMQGKSRKKTEAEACAAVTSEYPDECPCNCNDAP